MHSHRSSMLVLAAACAVVAAPLQAQLTGGRTENPSHTLRIDPVAAGYSATLTSFSGPYRYRNVALQAEHCGSAGVQPPYHIDKATLKPIAGTARRMQLRVPTGRSGLCELVGQFDLISDDDPPINPDDDNPIQGSSGIKPPLVWPDLFELDFAAAPTVQLGGTTFRWGSEAKLDTSQALASGGGVCTFGYSYKTVNNGGVAESTDNTLSLAEGSQLLARNGLPALHRGEAPVSSGGLQLRPGWSTLVLSVDSDGWLPEIDESNNLYALRVRVTGSCD